MRFARTFVAAIAASTLLGCASEQPPAAEPSAAIDTAAIAAALDSLGARVMRANETGDAALYESAWAEDGIMAVPGAAPIRGRDAIVEAFRNRPPLPPGARLTVHPTELEVLSADWAYAFGVDTLSHTPAGAAEPVIETMTFLVLIRRTADGWKTYREVLTTN